MRLASVSIDLDELGHYANIHGLSGLEVGSGSRVHAVAGARFGELMARHGLLGTAFAIGDALVGDDAGAAADAMRALAAAGHEIGNHSFDHDYRITRRPPCDMSEDVRRGAQTVAQVVGVQPKGFRAPGYNVSGDLLSVVAAFGHTYDSSVLPAWTYYAARAAIIGGLAALRRPSASLLGNPRVVTAPAEPYRPDPVAWWRAGPGPLVELPVAVIPGLGVPFIGTAVAALPWTAVQAAWKVLSRRGFVGLELHGIDLLDATDGIPAALVRRQPELRLPLRERMRRLDAVLGWMRRDYEVRPLVEVAARAGV